MQTPDPHVPFALRCSCCSSAASAPARSARRSRPGSSTKLVDGGLTLPTAFTTLPDGRLLVAEKDGRRARHQNGQLLATPFIDLRSSVNDYWDRGLLGIAADPNFATNGFVYLLYTYENDPTDYTGPKTGRLTRVTATGDVASPASALTILGTSVGSSCNDFPAGADCLPSDESVALGRQHQSGRRRHAVRHHRRRRRASTSSTTMPCARRTSIRSAASCCTSPPPGKGIPSNPFWNGDLEREPIEGLGLRAEEPVPASRWIRCRGCRMSGDVGWGAWEEINAATPCESAQLRLALLRGRRPSERL